MLKLSIGLMLESKESAKLTIESDIKQGEIGKIKPLSNKIAI